MPRVPEFMRENAARGLRFHADGKSGDVTPQTVREARQMAEQGDVPDNKPVRMAAWFARHMADLDGAPDSDSPDFPSRGQVAHLLWGGGVTREVSERAQAWAERTVRQQEREASVMGDKPNDDEVTDMDDMPGVVDVSDDESDEIVEEEVPVGELPTRAVMVVATEGEVTADGRVADVGGLSWREPPLSLTVNHDPDQRVGRLDVFARVSSAEGLTVDNFEDRVADSDGGPIIVALATLNLDTDLGREVAGEIRDGFLTGVSMEVGDEVIEYDEDGILHLIEGRIGAVSVVVFQAIETARVVEVASAHVWKPAPRLVSVPALVAASVPDVPPTEWFTDPGFESGTPLTVDDDGRIFGHLALWDTCHTGRPEGVCVVAPRSPSGYAYYRTGYVRTLSADGSSVDVPCGSVTMATGHASTRPGVSAAAAIAHYEHTGHAVADVAAGEDEFGVWVAGSLRPSVSEADVRELRGASLSGDWRSIGGNLELVAALAVNVPGFPVPRVQAGLAASGVQTALVAAGTVTDGCGCGDTDPALERRLRRLEAVVEALGLSDEAVNRLAARIG